MANSYTLGGTAKARGLSQVDPRLVQVIAAAAARSPYQVQIFSGKRAGSVGGSRHNSGNAVDIALIDPTTGEAIPNYKSSTGFPIYAEFAKIAREEQMRLAPDMADQFRWGGGFSDKDFDLMHFDFKPGGAMAYWTWQDGGKLTTAGAAAVPKFGPGYVYADGERRAALPGQYASLWGRDPLQAAPQDAQSAIASLIAPGGGTQVAEPPTAAMGFAPTIPDAGFGAPPMQMASAPPMPQPPPQWAQNGAFPIDESLTGQTAQDVLAGGPRMDPRRAPPGSGPVPADMGAMRSPLDVLNAGPNLDPRRAVASGPIGPTTPQGVLDMGPNLRPPNVPMPPPRPERGAGIPDPRMRPDPGSLPQRGFPTAFGEQPPVLAGGMSAAMGDAPSRMGDLSAAMGGPPSRSGDLSAAMGGPPDPFADFGQRDLAAELQGQRTIADANYYRPQNIMQPPSPPEAATMAERFDAASAQPNAGQMFGLPDMNGASFPAPPSPIGTAGAGSTTGEFFTPAPPMPSPSPDPMAGRFNDAFSPGGPGMIADLQGAFDRRQSPAPPAPPTMTAQDGINQIFGAPPAAAMPPNLAIPFNEVPGFMGVSPAAAATPALPPMGMGTFNDRFAPAMPAPPQPISVQSFNDRFAGGTVAPGGPPPPGTPGVVQGTMPGAMDIRPPAQGGPPLPPQALPQASPAPAPRQTNVGAERQRNGTLGRILGGLLGGPVGALGGGLLGGGGGGIFGGGVSFGGQPTFNVTGGGTSPYGNGGTTTYQKGTSNALGGSNALSWKSSNGGTVTAYTDPWSGQTFTSYGP